MFPGAQSQEERGWALTPQSSAGRGRSWERKASSKQVPVALHGNREDNRVVDNMARSKQKLCITAEPSGCLSMSCSTFGVIEGGVRMSVKPGKAQQHRHGTGLGRETMAAKAGGSALTGRGNPGLSRASRGQAAGQGSWSAAGVAPLVCSPACHLDGGHTWDW